MILLYWTALIGYPLLQGVALWQSRGPWRMTAWAILATAGTGYVWCVWRLWVLPQFDTSGGPLSGLLEFMGLSFGGPVVLLILAVIVAAGRGSRGGATSAGSSGG